VAEKGGAVGEMQMRCEPGGLVKFGNGFAHPPEVPRMYQSVTAIGKEVGREETNHGEADEAEAQKIKRRGSQSHLGYEKGCTPGFLSSR